MSNVRKEANGTRRTGLAAAALLVALGRFAADMRLLPFTETLESALDKVRAALSASAHAYSEPS